MCTLRQVGLSTHPVPISSLNDNAQPKNNVNIYTVNVVFNNLLMIPIMIQLPKYDLNMVFIFLCFCFLIIPSLILFFIFFFTFSYNDIQTKSVTVKTTITILQGR